MNQKLIVRLRSDTSSSWDSINPVLRPGEIAIDTSAGLYKIGNGKMAWKDLPYVGTSDPLDQACIYLPRDTAPRIKFEIPKKEEKKNDFGWITEPEDFRI